MISCLELYFRLQWVCTRPHALLPTDDACEPGESKTHLESVHLYTTLTGAKGNRNKVQGTGTGKGIVIYMSFCSC